MFARKKILLNSPMDFRGLYQIKSTFNLKTLFNVSSIFLLPKALCTPNHDAQYSRAGQKGTQEWMADTEPRCCTSELTTNS